MEPFDPKTLEALELPTILEILRGNCLTPYGSTALSNLAPLPDVSAIQRRLAEVRQLQDILQFGDPFPLVRIPEISAALKKSTIEGARLEAPEFLAIREVTTLISKLKSYKKGERENFPDLAEYLDKLGAFTDLTRSISAVFQDDGEINDNATPQLRKLRARIIESRRKVISKLEALLRSRKKSEGWQDDVVTERGGRFVVPIPANHFRASEGMVLDRSQTGATYYVEPQAAVELNNALSLAQQDERREIERILIELTGAVAEHNALLHDSLCIVGAIDSLHALALFAIKIKARAPKISEDPIIELRSAKHPLLMYYHKDQESVIPLDLALGENRQGILITGPNTGGKTVALKTVGLAALLIRFGIPIPADERSVVGLFDRVFADIGDEQSIELSLSTFSSHITKVIRAVRSADSKSLLLFDEVGAGTDPAEGSALAESVILDVIKRGARLIVTTHYSHLKTLPLSYPELENASLEFDRETLRPTYRLQLGVPGSSYAIEIAERLGMPERIVHSAAEKLGTQERSLADLIASMEDELRRVRADSAELNEKLSSARNLEALYNSRMENLNEELSRKEKSALAEAEQLVANTRIEMERVVKDIRETQAAERTVKEAHKSLRTRTETLKQRGKTEASHKVSTPSELAPGDTVWIDSLRIDGEVAELVGNDRVRVRVGNVLNLVPRSDVTKANIPAGQIRPRRDPAGMREETAPAREIHLRGMTVEEATEKLDKFLDSAVLSDLNQVYVVHGKGAGILRKALTSYLKQHSAVKSVRLGDWNQGGAGVTVVQLK